MSILKAIDPAITTGKTHLEAASYGSWLILQNHKEGR